MLIINKNKAPNKEEEKGARWKDSNPTKRIAGKRIENKSSS
jgi:hypothetical protein